MKITETEIKYLAGLIDADGSLSFEFTNKRVYLALSLISAESIDRVGYVSSLQELTSMGTVCKKERQNTVWSSVTVWKVIKAKDIEMLLPRLIKHLVIKGKHFQRMLDMWLKHRSVVLSDIVIEQLKIFAKASRADAGPVKDKKHPTWAWVAGYLDGDGSYIFKKPPSQKEARMLVQATAHEKDKIALDLLFKAFGGTLNNRGVSHPHIWDWKHSLGKANTSFAIHFLQKVLRHSKLKKHKIELMLADCHLRTRTD